MQMSMLFPLVGFLFLVWVGMVSGRYDVDESAGKIYTAFDSASWAISSDVLSPTLGTDKQSRYDSFISECDNALGKPNSGACRNYDKTRISMNRNQPSAVYNYTKNGYAKMKMPTALYDHLKGFFDRNRHLAVIEWKDYNPYHNAWATPPTMVYVEKDEHGGSSQFAAEITAMVKPILEEWTGQRLTPVSTYGVRLYHNGSILAPHVDRMPLISSVILQIDQDVEEPWPLEVYGHDGKATNVTMEPGDMVLYESHSVIHGRPFPMVGNYFANCFIHFEPLEPINGESLYDPDRDIPPYVIPDTELEAEWKQKNPDGWKGKNGERAKVAEELKRAVVHGGTDSVSSILASNPEYIHIADSNGWTAYHEAVRGGRVEMVQLVLSKGVDKDLLTVHGDSPLHLAHRYLDEDHDVIRYLESIGARSIFRHTEL